MRGGSLCSTQFDISVGFLTQSQGRFCFLELTNCFTIFSLPHDQCARSNDAFLLDYR